MLKRGCRTKKDYFKDVQGRTATQVAIEYNSVESEKLLKEETDFADENAKRRTKDREKEDKKEELLVEQEIRSDLENQGRHIELKDSEILGMNDKTERAERESGLADLGESERHSFLFTVEDLEQDNVWDYLEQFTLLPKKQLPQATEESARSAEQLRISMENDKRERKLTFSSSNSSSNLNEITSSPTSKKTCERNLSTLQFHSTYRKILIVCFLLQRNFQLEHLQR